MARGTLQTGALVWLALMGRFAHPCWAQSSLQGTIYERTAQTARPLPRAFVSISSPGGELLGTTRTDANGRYQFVDLPQNRLALTASKSGYLTKQAAGRAGERVIVDCSKGCRQSGLDFELSRGAVLVGAVLDKMHEPVSRAVVSVRRSGASASNEKPSTASTDDRGRFRLAGLKSGQYALTVQRRAPSGEDEVLTKALSVQEGEPISDLALALGTQESFRVAGRVSGIPFGEGYRTWVEVRLLAGSTRGLQASVGPEGGFQFDSVPPGRYSSAAVAVKLATVERTEYFLNTIEVLADTGVTLAPVEPAAVVGTVEVAAGVLPARAIIRLTSKDGFGSQWTSFQGAERRFEFSKLRPGSYRVDTDSPPFYVKGLKSETETASGTEVTLSPGLNRLAVIAAADYGQVFGVVRDPQTRRPLPHASVALQGDRGKHAVQADQAGRFVFGKVIPGEYRICAWKDIASDRVDDGASWDQAGCQSRIIPIAASSEVEIDLRAVP